MILPAGVLVLGLAWVATAYPEIVLQRPEAPTAPGVPGEACLVPLSSTVTIPFEPGFTPHTTGTIVTELDSRGRSGIPFPTSAIPPQQFAFVGTPQGQPEANVGIMGANPFTPISSGPPPFPKRGDHPFPRKSINDGSVPIGTNKFYSNLFLGSQTDGVFVQPYSLWWNKGTGPVQSWGISVSHIEANQLAFGPEIAPGRVQYYINPIRIESFTFSALEFRPWSALTLDDPTAASIKLNILANPATPGTQKLTMPLVQGMGFVTGLYDNLTPVFESGVFFKTVTKLSTCKPGFAKYRITLEDGRNWVLYATRTTSNSFKEPGGAPLDLSTVNNHRLQASGPFTGIIQVAKSPSDAAEAMYDATAGSFCTGMSVTASVEGAAATYSFQYRKGGVPTGSALLMWALPHHIASMTSGGVRTGVNLRSTTKGIMTAVVADSWTMIERELATDIGFFPWRPGCAASSSYSPQALNTIAGAVAAEVAQDMNAQTNLNSMYFSGKALSKFAAVCFVAKEIVKDAGLANTCITKLKSAFNRFASNSQIFPLVYDDLWKGVISSSIFITGDPWQDFGNAAYNDHHFHYGYHVHAAAILGYLDPSFLTPQIRTYINSLIRDYFNPVADADFPFMRAFDWFHGHSWAHGIAASADGKNEESTSEDYMSTYAVKLWGTVTDQPGLVNLAITVLAVTRRSLRSYFLMEDGNQNQPPNFIGNKVTGILFENKADYTTFFGMNKEFIHGIHMLPLLPISPYIRSTKFVGEELNAIGGDNFINSVPGGWRGILVANKAIVQPKAAWDFFAQNGFDWSWLDGGASRSWYLAWTGALAGV